MRRLLMLFASTLLMLQMFSLAVFAADARTDLSQSNAFVVKAIESVKSGDITQAKQSFIAYNKGWLILEDGVKEQSKQAYKDIENKMGMVQFLFSQDPVQNDKLLLALEDLNQVNRDFMQGKYKAVATDTKTDKVTVQDLVLLLEKARGQVKEGDLTGASKTMGDFTSSWLEVEGVVLTKSQKIYNDAEKDMVGAKAYLDVNPAQPDKALKTIDRMHGYLSPIAEETSYTTLDVITIILREGLEALLVVIALLGFLKKSGHEDKKGWIYGGVGIGLGVSIVLAVLVKVLFASGSFGSNNFLISGWTGVFAAVMLIYVSCWLHSKSSAMGWQNYIQKTGTRALATGSLFSLGLLAFLAVFREGTETVLFYIGMASSISPYKLVLGIGLGCMILLIVALLILKVGLRIPMKPFFMISSLLVFYLGLKFTGMGINGLQLAGVLPATTGDFLPSIPWLAVYPAWESFIPQVILLIGAVVMVLRDRLILKQTFKKDNTKEEIY